MNWTLFPFHKLFFSLLLTLHALLLDLNLNLNSVFVCLFFIFYYFCAFCCLFASIHISFSSFCCFFDCDFFSSHSISPSSSLTHCVVNFANIQIILYLYFVQRWIFYCCYCWLILMRWFIHFLHSKFSCGIVLKNQLWKIELCWLFCEVNSFLLFLLLGRREEICEWNCEEGRKSFRMWNFI